jgi:hypothetical protein
MSWLLSLVLGNENQGISASVHALAHCSRGRSVQTHTTHCRRWHLPLKRNASCPSRIPMVIACSRVMVSLLIVAQIVITAHEELQVQSYKLPNGLAMIWSSPLSVLDTACRLSRFASNTHHNSFFGYPTNPIPAHLATDQSHHAVHPGLSTLRASRFPRMCDLMPCDLTSRSPIPIERANGT